MDRLCEILKIFLDMLKNYGGGGESASGIREYRPQKSGIWELKPKKSGIWELRKYLESGIWGSSKKKFTELFFSAVIGAKNIPT